jgi:predicted nuclease of restriction endonuclease-like (RecB) superfamily
MKPSDRQERRKRMRKSRKARKKGAVYCNECSKLGWSSRELAERIAGNIYLSNRKGVAHRPQLQIEMDFLVRGRTQMTSQQNNRGAVLPRICI